MKLSDLHSARIEAVIEAALRPHISYHTCYCPECEEEHDMDDDMHQAGLVVYRDLSVGEAAKEILLALKKLEAELIPA